MHTTEFNSLAALAELYNYAFKYSDQLILTLEEDEFSTKSRLAYRLEQVHNIMTSDHDWQDAPPAPGPGPDQAQNQQPQQQRGPSSGNAAPGSYSPPGPYGGSPPHHVYPGGGTYGVSPPQSAVYEGQLETMFTYRGQDGGPGGPGGPGVDGSVYGLYGVPQHARLSPGAYGSAQFPGRGAPQVYEFEYEEPRFTWGSAPSGGRFVSAQKGRVGGVSGPAGEAHPTPRPALGPA